MVPGHTPVALLETDTFHDIIDFEPPVSGDGGGFRAAKTRATLSEAERGLLEQASIDPEDLLSDDQKGRLQDLLAKYVAVFAINPKKPGMTHAVEANFELKPGARPHRHPPSRLGEFGREIVEKEIAELGT